MICIRNNLEDHLILHSGQCVFLLTKGKCIWFMAKEKRNCLIDYYLLWNNAMESAKMRGYGNQYGSDWNVSTDSKTLAIDEFRRLLEESKQHIAK